MDDPASEKAKARRTLRILYFCMAVMIALPAVLFFVVHYR